MTSWPTLDVYANLESTRTDPTDPNTGSWANVGAYVQSLRITRGVTRWDGVVLRYQPGTAQLVLKNTDGRFDPLNLSGAYVSGGVSYVRPHRGLAIQAVWNSTRYYLFRGGILSWKPTYPTNGRDAICTVDCLDGMGFMAKYPDVQFPTAPFFTTTPTTSQRVRNWLLQVGSPFNEFLHSIAGIGSVGEVTLSTSTIQGDQLSGVQAATDAELGEFWIDGNAVCKFRTRRQVLTDARSGTSQATFQPGTTRPFQDVSMVLDTQPMLNRAYAASEVNPPDPVQADNTTAQNTYGIQGIVQDLPFADGTQLADWAGWVVQVAGNPELRLDNLVVNPQAAASTLFPEVLGRELGDRITIAFTPTGSSAISRPAIIRGIQHSVGVDSWTTSWTLQDATAYDGFLIFDDATRGKFDTGRFG